MKCPLHTTLFSELYKIKSSMEDFLFFVTLNCCRLRYEKFAKTLVSKLLKLRESRTVLLFPLSIVIQEGYTIT